MADSGKEIEPVLLSSGIPRFDLVLPDEPSSKLEEAGDTEVKHVEDMMVKSPLDGADLHDLEDVPMYFPSMASSTLYPDSATYSLQHPVCHNKPSPHNASVRQLEYLDFEFAGENYINIFGFLDLRALDQSIYVLQSDYKDDKKTELEILSEHLQCGVEEIQKLQNGCFVVGAKRQNIHLLFFSTEKNKVLFCMAVDRRTSLQKCQKLCVEWLQQSSPKTANAFCLIADSGLFPCSDDSVSNAFNDFDYIYIVKKTLLTVKIVLRMSTRTEKCFYIECYDTTSVKELKEKFCMVYQEEEMRAVDISCVWLLHKDKVPTDQQVLKNLWSPQNIATQSFDLEDLHLDAKHTFFAFICPPGSIPVKIHYKSDVGKYMKSECTIMVTPGESVDCLRNEISKVTHTSPLSFKLLVNGRKIDTENEPWTVLLSPSSNTIVVEQSTKIRLDVVASVDSSPSFVIQTVAKFKYESVSALRKEVCDQLKVPAYCVDLFHEANPLRDHKSLRSSRLRNNDRVTAVVLRNRVRVKIRFAGWRSKWVDIEVDDQMLTTVEQLKTFALCHLADHATKPSATVLHQETDDNFLTEMIAISRGVVLGEKESLKNAGINMNETVVLVEYEKCCFTATQGLIPIFFGKEDGQAQRVMAMCDGKKYYFASEDLQASEQTESKQQGAWTFPHFQRSLTHPGLRLCPEHPRSHFPESPSLPSLRSASLGKEICPMCRSTSMPLLWSPINSPVSVQQYHSPSANKNGSFPHSVDNSSTTREQGISTSTPKMPPEKLDFFLRNEQDSVSQPSALSLTEHTDANLPLLQAEHYSENFHWPVHPDYRQSTLPTGWKLNEQCLKSVNQNEPLKSTPGTVMLQTRVLDGDSGYFTEPVAGKWRQKISGSCTITDVFGRTISSQKVMVEQQCDKRYKGTCDVFGLTNLLRDLPMDEANNNSQQALVSSLKSNPGGNSMLQDNTYNYVRKEVIRKVAKALEEGERLRFFTSLGLEAKDVKDIEASSSAPFDRNFLCLERWLRQNRNVSALCSLKNVLIEMERKDIVESIELIQKCQGKCSCKSA